MARQQQATETTQGLVQFATDAEVTGGVNNSKAITPIKLKNHLNARYLGENLLSKLMFSPKDVAGLQAWYDATALANLSLANTSTLTPPVSQLTDLSGNSNHLVQATGTAQPTFNYYGGSAGLPYISFSSGKNLLKSGFAVSQPYTIYLVIRQNSIVNQGNILMFNTFTNGVSQGAANGNGLYNSLQMVAGTNWVPSNYPNNYYKNDFALYSLTFNGTNSNITINREPRLRESYTGSLNPGAAATVNLQMGATTNFDFQEMLFYSGVISDTNDNTIKGYIAEKYQLSNYDYIQFFGDSVTSGSGSTNASISSYAILTAIEKSKNYYNYGVQGETYANFFSHFKKSLLANNGWISIMYGTNVFDNSVSKSILQAEVAKLIRNGVVANKIILCTPPYSSTRTTLPGLNTNILAVSQQFGTQFADCYTATFNSGGDSLLADGTHPNDAGHRVIANTIKAVIV